MKAVLCLSISVGREIGSYPVRRQFESVLRHQADEVDWQSTRSMADVQQFASRRLGKKTL